MAKPKRELLKFRQGDCGLKIRKDGQLEVAGVSEDSPMIDTKGMVLLNVVIIMPKNLNRDLNKRKLICLKKWTMEIIYL